MREFVMTGHMKRAAMLLAAAIALSPLAAAEPITGRWITAEKNAVVAIAPCGKVLCGKIEKFLIAQPQGNDQRDVNNPDAAKRSRRLLGTAILSSFAQDGDVWRGQIYDPKNGKSYRSEIRRKSATVLEVKGCIGPFCQTQIWNRAS